jgi:hypothetical protein
LAPLLKKGTTPMPNEKKIFEKAKQEVHRTVSFAKTARGSGSVVLNS